MSDLKTVTGTLELIKGGAAADSTKFKLGGLTIKAWVAGRNICQTPQDVIVGLDKKPAMCKYSDHEAEGVTYHNASEVGSYAGAVAPGQSNGEGMSKAEWREKDDRTQAFSKWQSLNRTATDLMIAVIQMPDQPLSASEDVGAYFDALWQKVRETVDGTAVDYTKFVTAAAAAKATTKASMGTPTAGQAQTAEQLLMTAIGLAVANKGWTPEQGKAELDSWVDRAGLLNAGKIIEQGLKACDAADLGAFLTYLKQ